MLDTWVPLTGGLVLLVVGGDLLVRGAVESAARLGVSPMVIGLTLVGLGTSTPELVTSVQAALIGAPGIAFGNIVGSNIANVLLIVGAAAALFPIAVTSSALRRDGTVMLASAVAFATFAATTGMVRWIGAGFIATLGLYIYIAFRQERVERGVPEHGAAYERSVALQGAEPGTAPTPSQTAYCPMLVPVLIAIFGLLILLIGGALLIEGAVALATSFGISDTVIGLTIVAVGTSLPELVTTVMASLRRQSDVAFGNIVGSNIYNTLGIGGVTALMAPGPVPADLVGVNMLVMLAVSVLLVVFAWTGLRIGRQEGLVLLAGYGLYIVTLWP